MRILTPPPPVDSHIPQWRIFLLELKWTSGQLFLRRPRISVQLVWRWPDPWEVAIETGIRLWLGANSDLDIANGGRMYKAEEFWGWSR